MKKTDELGEYNDESVPDGLLLPLHLDLNNTALVQSDNVVVLRYGSTNETSVLLQEKRKAEFIVKLANGELIVRRDKKGVDRVFKAIHQDAGILKKGRLTVEYEEVK